MRFEQSISLYPFHGDAFTPKRESILSQRLSQVGDLCRAPLHMCGHRPRARQAQDRVIGSTQIVGQRTNKRGCMLTAAAIGDLKRPAPRESRHIHRLRI